MCLRGGREGSLGGFGEVGGGEERRGEERKVAEMWRLW